MKVGLLGGTFDPIHLGHLLLAEEARCRLGLERVLFIPTGQPWLRPHRPLASPAQRVEMARLALEDNPAFSLCTLEVERPGPSYTVETLETLRRDSGDGADFYFLLGADALREFPRWREPARVLDLCRLVVFPRPGAPSADLSLLEGVAPGGSERAVLLPGPLVGISGTEVRRRVAQGLSIRYWVPRPVEDYIARQGLYRSLPPEEGG